MYAKQVDKSHYDFESYMKKSRWISVWHQLQEVQRCRPDRVLEVGPGTGVFKASAKQFGINIETLDLDPALAPDHIGSVTEMPFDDGAYDVVCAFQMLEHLPYEVSLSAFREMMRVTRKKVVISLPDVTRVFRLSVQLPWMGTKDLFVPSLLSRPKAHSFDGQHYWEIGKKKYSLRRVIDEFSAVGTLNYTYRVPENTYHRFFIFSKT
jgi:SAM-dependent methyltransferase